MAEIVIGISILASIAVIGYGAVALMTWIIDLAGSFDDNLEEDDEDEG